uniref:target of EGR1 protein 1 n=1 Tax=Myxine glutinosa TaxID=7769 RepID=UPI00358E7B65
MSYTRVPVLNVDTGNITDAWPALRLALQQATFVALDTELSGLGPRKALQAQCLEERYNALKIAAQTRSVVALGLTCFSQSASEENTFRALVCDVTLLCSEPYMMDPSAATFLAHHGFSFNQQFCRGIPYRPPLHPTEKEGPSARALFMELVRAQRPLVVHNGLIDLAYAYHAFHAPLPPTLQAFMCDLVSLFPAGIYDTKFIAETTLGLSASYLAYAYRKCKRDNVRRNAKANGTAGHDERDIQKLNVEFGNFPQALSPNIDFRFCSPPPLNGEPEGPEMPALCKRFANYGFCPESSCLLSHDTDRAITRDEAEVKGRRRERQVRKKRHRSEGGAHLTAKIGKHEIEPGANVEDGPTEVMVPVDKDGLSAEKVVEHEGEVDKMEPQEGGKGNDNNLNDLDLKVDKFEADLPKMQKDETSKENCEAVGMHSGNDACLGGSHRAGFDAFMTAFVFAHAVTISRKSSDKRETPQVSPGAELPDEATPQNGSLPDEATRQNGSLPSATRLWLPDAANRLYVSGRQHFLRVEASAFQRPSKAHRARMAAIGLPLAPCAKQTHDSTPVKP